MDRTTQRNFNEAIIAVEYLKDKIEELEQDLDELQKQYDTLEENHKELQIKYGLI